MAKAYFGLAALTLLLATLMFFLAGLGVFAGDSFDAHKAVGGVLHVTTLLMLIVAAVGKLGRPALIFGGGLLVLVVVQGVLSSQDNVLGAFHPLLAVAFWFGSFQAFTWARGAAPARPAAAASARS